jgi:hypothetical protein
VRSGLFDPPTLYTEPKKNNLQGADAPEGEDAGATKAPSQNPKVKARSSPKSATPAAAVDAAVAAYNGAADRHGFSRCEVLTEARRKRLEGRLVDIGGVDAFKLALSAIPKNDFLMGRVSSRSGGKPFKLDIERLLSTGSGMGDVLAKLLDEAKTAARPARAASDDEEAELAATLARMRAEEGWS